MASASDVKISTEEKKNPPIMKISAHQVDTGAVLVMGKTGHLSPSEATRIRRKIDRHIVPRSFNVPIQYMDKATLGNAAVLGLLEDTHLSTDHESIRLGTIFYLGYLVFEFPQNLCLQRLPVGKWLRYAAFRIMLCMHAACKNFAGLFVGFMIVTSMFYTRAEQTLRHKVISGFISFETLHMKTSSLKAWQWFLFPDSPTNAWFLTPEERSSAVQRIKENQTGVENKHFKKEQYEEAIFMLVLMIEALTDVKIWLFAIFSVLADIPNSLVNQRQITSRRLASSTLKPFSWAVFPAWIPNSRAWVGVIYLIPNLAAVFLMLFLSWDNKLGLLLTLFFAVLSLSWLSSTTAGHTKRIAANAIILSAYCIGNAVGPLMWAEKFKPRNCVPWIIIGFCVVFRILTLLGIRDAEPVHTIYDDVYIEQLKENGVVEKARVDKEFLDLTDKQNRDFRYVL
ncbi:uncharacterized protein EV420DRAFT_1619153 [Desarmillaria tabescens]|uniref:MFS general substrate transporter n=1 Tax=Armillaria tabescens TaxID=1929756 RepID=A0AA39N9N4_ARMTA|nr:uncharacterized protein EV420DRAFT_1619153 [Desarmillaria tabescens]KAK0461597.1 hypothetical protein EV420DRAFT_1619153 [Desarmillaria tabescens]